MTGPCSTSGLMHSTTQASTRSSSTYTTCRMWYATTFPSVADPPAIRTVFEPELLGSAGTLAANRQWIDDEDFFLACNADNLTDFDLRSLIDAHRAHGPVATLAVFHSERPSAGGVVELDDTGRVIGFTEKPDEPLSDLVNAGMYAFHPSVLDEMDGTLPQRHRL